MRHCLLFSLALVFLAVPCARADEPQPKPDLGELSKILQKHIVPQVPKEHEVLKDWGKTTPVQQGLRLNRLRKTVRVGDRDEFPHGVWQRYKVWLDDPNKDMQIEVTAFEKIDQKTMRLHIDTTVRSHAEGERKRWEKGLQLFGMRVQADTTIVIGMDCDVQIIVSGNKFPPNVQIDPKITDCKLQLKEFEVKRLGPVIGDADLFKELSDDLKGTVEMLLKSQEDNIKKMANEAIAKAIKDGKGNLSPAALLKLAPLK